MTSYLESLQRESCYRVDAVLKKSPSEETQLVYFVGSNGAESGLFIRKFIDYDKGLGSAYERIYAAQQRGKRFKFIPSVLECYSRNSKLVVVMEFVVGDTLQEAVEDRGPSIEFACSAFPLLCDAVCELHEEFDQPIIHRDLKPGNVILSDEGLVLIDFGIARTYREGADADTNRFGTREYAAPEQFGFGQTSVRSDIYSLSLVLFYLLTGTIPSASQRDSGFGDSKVPDSLREVIARASAFDPCSRFGSVRELKEAFEASVRAMGEGMSRPFEHVSSESARESGQIDWVGEADRSQEDNDDEGGDARTSRLKALKVAGVASLALLVVVLIIAFMLWPRSTGASSPGEGADAPSSSIAASTGESTIAESETSDTGSSGNSPQNDLTEDSAESLAHDIQMEKTPKNGFDERSNFVESVAGLDFQIPSYFKSSVKEDDQGSLFYYAERGSSVAMIALRENYIGGGATREDFETSKNGYLSGFIDSSPFDQIVSYSDCELAGYAARVVTLKGALGDLPLMVKMAYFYNPELETVGSVTFGQSTNVQFDYSYDFARVITSATRKS